MKHFRDFFPLDRPMIFAHRGDSMHAPENTIEAAERGHQAGADGWELDVRITRDSVPIVVHDAALIRTTDVQARFADDPRRDRGFLVSDFDWDEIQTLDAGSWFVSSDRGHRSAGAFGSLGRIARADRDFFASGKIRVPSLAQALDFTRDRSWLVNVEIKSFPESDARLVAAISETIRSSGIAERILVSSFDHNDLPEIARLIPGIATGVLTMTPLAKPREYVRDLLGADFYHASSEVLGSGSDRYRHQPVASSLKNPPEHGLPTLVYTVNDPLLAANLAEIGVAGVFTDDPRKILAIWQK